MSYEFTVHASGLGFTEAPRWHDNAFYFSDFNHQLVRRINGDGTVEDIAHVPKQPSGLGWLPDGRMLVVSMVDHKVLCQDKSGQLYEYADLSHIATGVCNDMVVDQSGRAYVGNFGGSNLNLDSTVAAKLAMVDTDGTVSVAATDLNFPNGTVISTDGRSLIIAETFSQCLTAFDVDSNGALSKRRIWANISPSHPDGICQDAEGALWVATVYNEVIRVHEGGRISERITTPDGCYACSLGGSDGKTLYLCLNGPQGGSIVSTRVAVGAAACT